MLDRRTIEAVCSEFLARRREYAGDRAQRIPRRFGGWLTRHHRSRNNRREGICNSSSDLYSVFVECGHACRQIRSEEHTSELQSLMRISYAVFCLKKKKINKQKQSGVSQNAHQKSHHCYVKLTS